MHNPSGPLIDRREFLRRVGVTGAAVAGLAIIPSCRSVPPDTGALTAVPKPIWDPAGELGSARYAVEPKLKPLFQSFMMGGFECSTHYNKSGIRLDLIASTSHDRFVKQDYARLQSIGMRTCRDAVRWHLIESTAGNYDFDTLLPMVRAAQQVEMEVIWDLMHYGWPDHVDIYGSRFPEGFAKYAAAVARVLDDHTPAGRPVFITPVNEISFLSWAGGDTGYLNPYDKGRGAEMKRQLVRAAIAAMDAIKAICPRARFMHCDPIVNVVGRRYRHREQLAAEAYRTAQFQAYDMLIGQVEPQLGGRPEYLDIVGVNYYRNNQTYYDGRFIGGNSRYYKPLAEMLVEMWERYKRPMIIAETGIEDDERARWFRYIAGEAGRAMLAGVDLHGITWYPIVDHPGWEDNRHCRNGLWGYADGKGERPIYQPLASEIRRQTPALVEIRNRKLSVARHAG